jgi:DNA-binding response OmpR family regulator
MNFFCAIIGPMAKIAIIEDDQAVAQMYRMKFESDGHEVATAANGRLGLELIESMKPDVILLDIMMPDMPGDEMLEKLRQTDWGKTIKVVVLTNRDDQGVIDSVGHLDVSAIIVKANMTPRKVAELVAQQLKL